MMAFNVIWGLYLKHSKGSSAFPRRGGAGRAKSATGAGGQQEIRVNSWREFSFCGARAKGESFSTTDGHGSTQITESRGGWWRGRYAPSPIANFTKFPATL